MKSLYRRYRPKRLDEVVGQEQVTGPLGSSLKAGKIGHAYLFVGPRGCGKTSVARILAHEVNGFEYNLEDDYVDIIEIDGASNRGIDNIRELREKVMVAPTAGKYKVYIIDEVHMLTKEAFNALLKTLEEPPESVIFIMATTDAYKVPVTITSRAQTYTFKLAEPGVMEAHLRKIADAENIKIDDEALAIIARRGGGSFRDSLSLLDQISTLSSERITKDLVMSAMGLPDDEKMQRLLNAYTGGQLDVISGELKELLASGVKPETVAEEMIRQIIAEPRVELLPLLEKLPEVKEPFAVAKMLVALCRAGSPQSVASMSVARPIAATHAQASRPVAAKPAVRPQPSAPAVPPVPEKAPGPEGPVNTQPTAPFAWEEFLQKVQAANEAVYLQLAKASYQVGGGTLNIYPEKKIGKTILARDNNKKILVAAASGLKVVVGDPGDNPSLKNDALLSKISDIMGGEVQNDTGGSPF